MISFFMYQYYNLNFTQIVFPSYRLTIRSFTWTKESHGLFDYDLKDVLNVTHETKRSTNILRDDLTVMFSNETQENLIAKIG